MTNKLDYASQKRVNQLWRDIETLEASLMVKINEQIERKKAQIREIYEIGSDYL